jgi:hypothetical protein
VRRERAGDMGERLLHQFVPALLVGAQGVEPCVRLVRDLLRIDHGQLGHGHRRPHLRVGPLRLRLAPQTATGRRSAERTGDKHRLGRAGVSGGTHRIAAVVDPERAGELELDEGEAQ